MPIAFVRPLIVARQQGIIEADAHMQDGSVIRFRVLSRDPPVVILPRHKDRAAEAEIEQWLDRQ